MQSRLHAPNARNWREREREKEREKEKERERELATELHFPYLDSYTCTKAVEIATCTRIDKCVDVSRFKDLDDH